MVREQMGAVADRSVSCLFPASVIKILTMRKLCSVMRGKDE
jgi:hypothetical protein